MLDSNNAKWIEEYNPFTISNEFVFDWKHQIEVVGTKTIGYFNNGTVVGMVNFTRKKSSLFNEVNDLEGVDNFQGLGIGRLLLATVMLDSFGEGFEGFVALTTKTTGVQDFYLQVGGTFVASRRIVFSEDVSRELIRKHLNREV